MKEVYDRYLTDLTEDDDELTCILVAIHEGIMPQFDVGEDPDTGELEYVMSCYVGSPEAITLGVTKRKVFEGRTIKECILKAVDVDKKVWMK